MVSPEKSRLGWRGGMKTETAAEGLNLRKQALGLPPKRMC